MMKLFTLVTKRWRITFSVFALQKKGKSLENAQNIKIAIEALLKNILELEIVSFDEIDSLHDLEGWDSVAHITLVSSIEDLYSLTFSLQELEEITTLSNIVSIVDRKLKA